VDLQRAADNVESTVHGKSSGSLKTCSVCRTGLTAQENRPAHNLGLHDLENLSVKPRGRHHGIGERLAAAVLTGAAVVGVVGGSGEVANAYPAPLPEENLETSESVSRPSLLERFFKNPVVDHGAPDPGVSLVGDTYVRATTGVNHAGKFPLSTSKDLIHWSAKGAIFEKGHFPRWAESDFWAPEVHPVDGRLVAYYTARDRSTGMLSIGVAVRQHGRFVDAGRPLINDADVGMIDAHFFRDPKTGKNYLYWKSDGNAVGKPTWIFGQELSGDGLRLKGHRVPLMHNDRAYEGKVIEAPWVVEKNGTYHLLRSFGVYSNETYGGADAVARSPLGPFRKVDKPFLVSGGGWTGPGHFSIVPSPPRHPPDVHKDKGGLPVPPSETQEIEAGSDWFLLGHAQKGNHVSKTTRVDVLAEVEITDKGVRLVKGNTIPNHGTVPVPRPVQNWQR
jgi:hypothetical protein